MILIIHRTESCLQSHTVRPVHSAPGHLTNESNSSLFTEQQPLMHSASEPHIISRLPSAGHITHIAPINSNSKHQLHKNPNYRLSQSNNLSNIPHPHHHFNDDDEDIRYSPRAINGMKKVPSTSTKDSENNDVIVEMEEVVKSINVKKANESKI